MTPRPETGAYGDLSHGALAFQKVARNTCSCPRTSVRGGRRPIDWQRPSRPPSNWPNQPVVVWRMTCAKVHSAAAGDRNACELADVWGSSTRLVDAPPARRFLAPRGSRSRIEFRCTPVGEEKVHAGCNARSALGLAMVASLQRPRTGEPNRTPRSAVRCWIDFARRNRFLPYPHHKWQLSGKCAEWISTSCPSGPLHSYCLFNRVTPAKARTSRTSAAGSGTPWGTMPR